MWVIPHRQLVLYEAVAILSVYTCVCVFFPGIVSLCSRADMEMKNRGFR